MIHLLKAQSINLLNLQLNQIGQGPTSLSLWEYDTSENDTEKSNNSATSLNHYENTTLKITLKNYNNAENWENTECE